MKTWLKNSLKDAAILLENVSCNTTKSKAFIPIFQGCTLQLSMPQLQCNNFYREIFKMLTTR